MLEDQNAFPANAANITSGPPIPSMLPIQSKGKRGRPRIRPIAKPCEEWTEDEKESYKKYISSVRSRTGRMGGYVTHANYVKPPSNGRSKVFTVCCRSEDHLILTRYAQREKISLAEVLHQLAERLKGENPSLAIDKEGK